MRCQTEPRRPEEWYSPHDGSRDFHFGSCVQVDVAGMISDAESAGEYLVFLKIMYQDLKK